MTDTNPAEELMKAFDAFKAANDDNIRKRDVVLDEKINKIQDTLDKHEAANADLTKKALGGQDAIQEQVDRLETLLNRKALGGAGAIVLNKEEAEYRSAFCRALRRTPDARAAADVDLINKRKATLIKGDDAGAGYLVAPPDYIRDIMKDLIEISPMRALATVRTISGPSLKRPKRTAAAGAARRVGEVEPRTNTADPKYGMLEFKADEMYARGEISVQMLEDEDYDLEMELREEFAEQFALKEGNEYISGTGAGGQAEGFLSNALIGEVVSGSGTAVTGDGLINLYYSLKTAHTAGSSWVMNRLSIRDVRKLKDTSNQYLWQPGLAQNVPNTILGAPYTEMPGMPDIAANAYPIAFGNWRKGYVIVDRVMITIQPDYVTGADMGVVVYRARKRVGGGVMQDEALKKLKIST